MIAICEFCGREANKFPEPPRPICRNLADMAIMDQKGDEDCRRALLDRLSTWTLSESGISLSRTTNAG